MALHLWFDGGIHRRSEVGNGLADAQELGGVEPPQDRSKDLVTERIDFAKELLAGVGHADDDHSPILGHPVALDEATFGHPVDETGGVRVRHVEDIRELAHGHLAVSLHRVHDVDLGHAHALAQEPLTRGAFELGHGRPEIGDDGAREVGGQRQRSSCHMNNIADTDHPVNLNGPCRMQE